MAALFGRHKWLRLPFGVSPAPKLFQWKLDEALCCLNGVMSIADDTLIIGEGDTTEEAFESHDQRFIDMLERCRQRNLRIHPDKMYFRRTEVPFVGHVLTSDGLKMQQAKGTAITSMRTPENTSALR